MKKAVTVIFILVCFFTGSITNANAEIRFFNFTVSEGKATITGFIGHESEIAYIPSTIGGYPVVSIGPRAFQSDYDLTAVIIPEGVTSIGYEAFSGCSSLTSINIPYSVISIDYGAFEYCDSLASINISKNVLNIGKGVFNFCYSLEYINVASENPNYLSKNGILYNKAMTKLIKYPSKKSGSSFNFPLTISSIEDNAFNSCKDLTSISIPNGITSIGSDAFSNCVSLENVILPNGLKSIGDYAFNYCESLKSITIPNGITSLGEYVLHYCTSLTSVTIPNSVVSIGERAIGNCWQLDNLTIPESVTSIGEEAFWCNNKLKSITIPNSVTQIGRSAFENCSSLSNISISNKLTSIEDWTFSSCSNLKSITIPVSVTSIGYAAFSECSSLETIIIPDSVTIIEYGAFAYCNNIKIHGYTSSIAEAYASDNSIPFVSLGLSPIKILSITADHANASTDSIITWTATVTGGSVAKTYRFKLFKDGIVIADGTYGSDNTYKYTPIEAGTYKARVYVREDTFTVTKDSENVIVNAPLTITSVKADKTSVNVGSAITWTAAAAGGGGTKAYRFLLYKDGANLTGTKYTTSASYKYTPTAAGTYRVRAYVMDSTGTVSLKSADVIAKVPLSITSVKADTTNTVIGSAITWTTAATGGSGAKTYRFKLYKNGAEFIGGTFSSASTYKYSPVDAGTYKVRVYVKDSTGTVTKDSADVTVNKPLSITSVTADKTSANAGTAITWTVAATGGIGTKSYRFLVYKDGTVLTSSKYTTSAAYKYTPTEAGTYRVRAYVMDITGTVSLKSADLTVKAPLTITSIVSDTTSKVIGSEITWTATATGGNGTKTYRFKLYKDDVVIEGGTYGSASTFKYTPTEAGIYLVRVYVKDSTVTVTKDSKNVKVE